MTDIPKPKNLKYLILFLEERPNLSVQTSLGKKKIKFEKFSDGCFNFDEPQYNFCLHNGNKELGLTIVSRGFIVHKENSIVNYTYSTSEA